jgi:hypothetical protein
MKQLKTFEMWTTSATSKNVDIKYADNKNIDFLDKPKPIQPKPKPEPTYAKLSKLGKDIIEYIKYYYNYHNGIKITEINFISNGTADTKTPKISKIEIFQNTDNYTAHFTKWPSTKHTVIITENDYEYIKKFLQNEITEFWIKQKEKEEKDRINKMKLDKSEIEDIMKDPIKLTGNKYNL